MAEEKRPDDTAPAPAGRVLCSFCDGYDRNDGGSVDVTPLIFYGGNIPTGKIVSICPKCFLAVVEIVLGKKADFIDWDAPIDWQRAFRV